MSITNNKCLTNFQIESDEYCGTTPPPIIAPQSNVLRVQFYSDDTINGIGFNATYYGMFLHTVKGWSGGANVSCILRHRGVQLILAYSWARPAILVASKGRGKCFLFLLFLHFHSCSSFFSVPLFHLFYYLFYLFAPFFLETTQNDPQGLTYR